MSDLLPYNATDQERALAETTARISDVPVIVREVWNPDTCPENVLPWLAWAFSVDDWDSNWTTAQKRQSIKNSVQSQRIKGTIGAVKNQLAALGVNVEVREWFAQDPIGAPYTFEIYFNINQDGIDQTNIDKIFGIVDTYKNLRSHLTKTQIIASSTSQVIVGAVTSMGTEISCTNYVRVVGALNDFVMPQANINIGD